MSGPVLLNVMNLCLPLSTSLTWQRGGGAKDPRRLWFIEMHANTATAHCHLIIISKWKCPGRMRELVSRAQSVAEPAGAGWGPGGRAPLPIVTSQCEAVRERGCCHPWPHSDHPAPAAAAGQINNKHNRDGLFVSGRWLDTCEWHSIVIRD